MKLRTGVRLLGALSFFLLAGCMTNVREAAPDEHPSVPVEEARAEVRKAANDTLRELYRRQPTAQQAIEGATGYAVFSNFGMKIMVAGGGSGKGMAVNNRTGQEVFMRMAEVQAGLGFGVKKFRLVWVFQTPEAFDQFVNSGYQLGAHAALAAKAGTTGGAVAGAVSVSPGVWIYQLTDTGIAPQLTVKGTKYYRDNQLN